MSHRSRIAILSSIGFLGLLLILWKIDSSPIDKRPIVEVPSSGTTLAWDTEGNRLAIANTDGRILIWDKSDDTYIPGIELPTSFRQDVMALAWSPDASLLAGGDFEGHILIWHVGTGSILHDIIGDGTFIDSIVWSPNGDKIAVTNTRNVVVWDVLSSRVITSFHINDLSDIKRIALTPDGQTIAVIGGDGITRIWNLVS